MSKELHPLINSNYIVTFPEVINIPEASVIDCELPKFFTDLDEDDNEVICWETIKIKLHDVIQSTSTSAKLITWFDKQQSGELEPVELSIKLRNNWQDICEWKLSDCKIFKIDFGHLTTLMNDKIIISIEIDFVSAKLYFNQNIS